MRNEKEKIYEFWLHNLPGVGDRIIEKLLAVFGSAEQIYRAPAKDLEQVIVKKEQLEEILLFRKKWEPEKEFDRLLQKKISFYTLEDAEYPERIRKLVHPPFGIYCRGKMPPENKPAVAVIGARECSEYGICMAEAFGKAMAMAGVPVISGMARGIDGIGQQAALSAEGQTWAVLGCGVDICYPASNRSLYDRILDTGGGILSVVPPGTKPIKHLFPERNRIVAGLCDVLLVVEARQKSGTWITVDMALEQGKSVYAIPGRLTDRLSDGCNMLIRQGAGIALSPEDLLAELRVMWNPSRNSCEVEKTETNQDEEKKITEGNSEEGNEITLVNCDENSKITYVVSRYLDFLPKSADQIWEEMLKENVGKTLPEVFAELIDACLNGKAKQVSGSYFVKTGV